MRKISGIALVIAGFVLISFCAYQLINYMTTMEKIKAHIESSRINHFNQGVYYGEIATGFLLLAGIGAVLGGYKLKNTRSLQ